jgi:hypothetical protein
VQTEPVLPEVRVAETATLSIGDERIVLSTKLDLEVARAGIFAVDIAIPQDFDVETVSGPAVSHWDELGAAEATNAWAQGSGVPGQPKTVAVTFARRVTDAATINLVIARSENGTRAS